MYIDPQDEFSHLALDSQRPSFTIALHEWMDVAWLPTAYKLALVFRSRLMFDSIFGSWLEEDHVTWEGDQAQVAIKAPLGDGLVTEKKTKMAMQGSIILRIAN